MPPTSGRRCGVWRTCCRPTSTSSSTRVWIAGWTSHRRRPFACAHLLGQIIQTFGADHVLWGTDSIWYSTPQWQIEAFRRLEIPQALIDAHGYQPLTRPVKEQIFGLNAAPLFNVDAKAKHNEIPKDYLTRMKMAYLDEGADPSHRWYGWVAG